MANLIWETASKNGWIKMNKSDDCADNWSMACSLLEKHDLFVLLNPKSVYWWPSRRHKIFNLNFKKKSQEFLGRILIETPPGQVSYYAAKTQQKLKEPYFFWKKAKTHLQKLKKKKKMEKAKTHSPPPELPVLVFIHGESWSWGSARWITRIVAKPNPI